MTGFAIALLALRTTAFSVMSYDDVPLEVVRVSVHGWEESAPPVLLDADVRRDGNRVSVRSASERRVLVRFDRADGSYLLDGPLPWPVSDATRPLDLRWRQTIGLTGAGPGDTAATVEWIAAGESNSGSWPHCFPTGDRRWTCWGAPAGGRGVFACRVADGLWWSVRATAAAPLAMRLSKWGRLLVDPDESREGGAELRVRFGYPLARSTQRVAGVRLDTAPVPRAVSVAVAPGAAWVAGDVAPPDAWIELRSDRRGPAYVALDDIVFGTPSVPIAVRLPETRAIDGHVSGARDQPGGGALVTLFRLIDSAGPSSPGARKPRRVFAMETVADASGAFRLDGAGDADYEVVAWHPVLGRAVSMVPRAETAITLRLESPAVARGRVLAGGKPVAGVEVVTLPAPDALRTADDLIDLKGGDARTGADGRFAVTLAAGGGGELKVGGGAHPTRRIALPRSPSTLVDLGDIDLGPPIEITLVLDQDSPCDLRATGPVGQGGLQIVTADRKGPGLFQLVLPEAGFWEFGLLCGRDEHPLEPAVVRIGPALAGKEVRFSIR